METGFTSEFLHHLSEAFGDESLLTAWVVGCLLAVFSGSLVVMVIQVVRAFSWVSVFKKALDGVSPESAHLSRRKILGELEGSEHVRALWVRYDRTLLEVSDVRTESAFGAEYIINPSSFRVDLCHNRFINGVPGFLTAIGVIGTFLGLQIGLSSLGGGGDETSSDALRSGIFDIIGGASVAFTTSIWGVGCSLIFNMTEKALDTFSKNKISTLAHELDHLFPFSNTASMLHAIMNESRGTKEAMALLDEKIAERMQEAVAKSHESLAEGMQEAVGPLLEKLAQSSSDSAESVSRLVENFLEKAGDAGAKYKEDMHSGASVLEKMMESIQASMSETASAVKVEISGLADQLAQVNHQMVEARDVGSQGVSDMSEQVKALLVQISEANKQNVNTLDQQQASLDGLRSLKDEVGVFVGTLNSASEKYLGIMKEAGEGLERGLTASESTADRYHHLSEEIKAVAGFVERSSDSLAKAAGQAENGFSELRLSYQEHAKALSDYAAELEGHVSKLMKNYARDVDAHTNDRLSSWVNQTNEYTSVMIDAIRALSGVVDELESKSKAISA